MSAKAEGRHIHITGIVQGVGFRPFVYGLATRYKLEGWVLNDSSGVKIEVIGPPEMLSAFINALRTEAPPLAVIDSLQVKNIPLQSKIQNLKSKIFQIRHSQAQAEAFVPISPDICICDDCRRELYDPADRRYRYPFINCTNCGPRFTIIRDIPYDRPLTTMADFPMCPDCWREYEDPGNRRFHAQPNACPRCGPRVEFRWAERAGQPSERTIALANLPGGNLSRDGCLEGEEAIKISQKVLAAGGIVAVKGLGGFHLACDARNDEALQTLRQRKGRVDKPFAVMALDVAAVEQFAEVNPQERSLLTSKERPIVLLKKKPDNPLSELVSPGNRYIGVMLPYTPLHYLLLNPQPPTPNPQLPVLVMTSGNFSEEPIMKDNAEALERLAALADAFLLHNRDIHIHCDDSVVRVLAGRELPIRRSRGYAPFPVKLPFPVEQILAVGGELKNTFCLTKGNYAFMSQHIGDMENLETWRAFEKSVKHFQTLFRVEPKIFACDMHPGYLSSKWAREVTNDERRTTNPSPHPPAQLVEVQHHHAHIAAVMAEYGLDGSEPVIGFSFDGTGYGTDGTIWGGEVLVADYKTFARLAHLKYVPLPGGDAAIKRPYRTALAHLWAAGLDWDERLPPVAACQAVERGLIRRQLETGFNAVPTSSMGRLFDAVASLAGIRQTVTYEAQAAIEFEAIMAVGITEAYPWGLTEDGGEIDAAPLIQAVVTDVQAGVPAPVISAKFHNAVANLVLILSGRLREKEGLNRVALSGGVFQNVTLLELTVNRLRGEFEVLTHRLVPPNDGGLALGQAIVANFLSN